MERSMALLVLCACAGAVAVMAASEVPIHYSTAPPAALQQHDEQPRFAAAAADADADADAEVEGDEVVQHDVDHIESDDDTIIEPVKVPWKEPDAFTKETTASDDKLSGAEEAELARVDSVMAESTNTMTQSARCLMHCANGYGLCTRTNEGGCACAAGCMCNRGEAEATCSEHCHPDNQMNFVYGYHDANHFSPHFWGKTIGDVMTHYGQVRACLVGCAKRGKCAPRFCPRHPSGGYKCADCQRLEVVPIRGSKAKRYYTTPRPSRDGHIHHIVHHTHEHDAFDHFGHLHRHSHSHAHHHVHYPAFVESETESEAETESHSEAEAETGMKVVMESNAEADQMVEADAKVESESESSIESEAQAEADAGYVTVSETPYATTVTSTSSNIRPLSPRRVPEQFIAPYPGDDHADNGIVSSVVSQDPLAAQIDCNFYDCTGVQSEPYVPVGSMNPNVPYRYKPDTRTTTFSTVPDMLEPRAESKFVVVA